MPIPNIQKVSSKLIAECTATEVAAALTRSFEGYILGPVDVDERAYERRFRAENLDPFASRVYFLEEWPVGVLLVARRGWTSRIAGMGIVPEARRKGLGLRVMHEAIKDAESRGDHSVVLEVFEQNLPAVELYAGLGFRKRRRLVGYGKERTKTSREKPQAAFLNSTRWRSRASWRAKAKLTCHGCWRPRRYLRRRLPRGLTTWTTKPTR